MMKRLIYLTLSLLMTAGCQVEPAPETINEANCGPYPANYQESIRAFCGRIAVDPDPNNTRIRYGEPKKGFMHETKDALSYEYGWLVPTWVNSKNRMGGWTGERPWKFLLRNNEIRLIQSMSIEGYFARPSDWD